MIYFLKILTSLNIYDKIRIVNSYYNSTITPEFTGKQAIVLFLDFNYFEIFQKLISRLVTNPNFSYSLIAPVLLLTTWR